MQKLVLNVTTGELDVTDLTADDLAAMTPTLAQAQSQQLGMLATAYATAVVQPVSYTSKGGVTKSYQADATSQANVQAALVGYTPVGAVPAGFYWVASDNTQVPFTLADIQGLASAMLAQGWSAFQHLQAQKAAILAASSVAAVQAVTW